MNFDLDKWGRDKSRMLLAGALACVSVFGKKERLFENQRLRYGAALTS